MACRKFCSKRKRSATCRACGTPRAAPCAYRPQRVTAHRFNRRMPPRAGGVGGGVYHGCALPPAPLIDTDHANRGRASPITHIALQRSQEGVLALGARLGVPQVAHPTSTRRYGSPDVPVRRPHASGGRMAEQRPADDRQRFDWQQSGFTHRHRARLSRTFTAAPELASLQIADIRAVASARPSVACWTTPGILHGRRHGPPAIYPFGLRYPDAEARRPFCVCFHATSFATIRKSSPTTLGRSHCLSQTHTD